VGWLLYGFAALLALHAADAALVFQDRHTDSSGTQIVYSFETNSQETASPVDQTQATKIATSWAAKYYKLWAPSVVSVQTRSMPIRFWLIQLSASIAGKRETFYAVVLPNGLIVEPTDPCKGWKKRISARARYRQKRIGCAGPVYLSQHFPVRLRR
jgi:hypothetical protein